MAIYKNKAGQKIAVFAYDSTDGSAKTGDAANITAQISLDGGATAATNDVNPTELDATDAKGVYIFDPTQAESNADLVVLAAVSATANILIEPVIIYTEPEQREANVTAVSGSSTAADNAEVVFATDFATNYNATRNAWATNAQDFVGTTASDPFNGQVVAASVTGNVGGNVVGSVGSVTGSVGSVTGGINTAAGTITTLDGLDTAQDTQHGTTQTAIGQLNDLSAAQVNAEVDTALGEYDGPTNAEMEARTLVAASYATATNQTTILNRLGAWTGTGVNTVLGAFKALLNKAASAPSDIGGTFDPTVDSTEAIRDHIGDGTNLTEAGGTGDQLTAITAKTDNIIQKGTQYRYTNSDADTKDVTVDDIP